MKIALICPDSLPCPPIQSGAIELLIDRKAPYLADLGFEVTIISIQSPLLENIDWSQSVKFIRLPKSGYFQEVLKYLELNAFDLIQVYNKPRWALSLKKQHPHTLIVLSLHNLVLGHGMAEQETNEIVLHVDQIVAVSKFVANDVLKRCPMAKGKIMHAYTGEAPLSYTPHYTPQGQKTAAQMKEKLGIPKEFSVLLFVGRLHPKKGCHLVIQAMKKLMQHDKKIALVIVGSKWYGRLQDSEYIGELKEMAKLISEHIYFTNYLPIDEVPDYYTMSDIFVCASQWQEPLARVHYEAMAAGIPIVTTRRGGNAEIVLQGKNGYVIEAYNQADAFAVAIRSLLINGKQRLEMGTVNRRLIEEKYNFQQYALKLSQLYQKIRSKQATLHR